LAKIGASAAAAWPSALAKALWIAAMLSKRNVATK
jgi:hypothetical protein